MCLATIAMFLNQISSNTFFVGSQTKTKALLSFKMLSPGLYMLSKIFMFQGSATESFTSFGHYSTTVIESTPFWGKTFNKESIDAFGYNILL